MDNIVLLVDDNKDLVDMLTVLFLQNGWVAQRAYNGAEAMACVRRTRPTVVVCDLAMPHMSGFDVAESLIDTYQSECPTLIALTAWSDPGVAQQALEAGFSKVLIKPFDFEQLLSVVNATLPQSHVCRKPAAAKARSSA